MPTYDQAIVVLTIIAFSSIAIVLGRFAMQVIAVFVRVIGTIFQILAQGAKMALVGVLVIVLLGLAVKGIQIMTNRAPITPTSFISQ